MPEGADLNNFLAEGRYTISSAVVNAPDELMSVYGFGILCVFAGGSYVLQILACHSKAWYRLYADSWRPWQQI